MNAARQWHGMALHAQERAQVIYDQRRPHRAIDAFTALLFAALCQTMHLHEQASMLLFVSFMEGTANDCLYGGAAA